ncbi:MAG: NADH-quinone oxidoreductase subunit N [Halobacteria archaeon]
MEPLLLLLILGAFGLASPALDRATKERAPLHGASLLALAASLAYAALLWATGPPGPALGGMLRFDAFALFFTFLVLTGGLIALLAVFSHIKPDEPHQGEFHALLLLSLLGMVVVSASADLVPLFVGFELSSLSTFALVAYRKSRPEASEAAMKFFVVGAFSAALMLFGISLLYGVTGTTRLDALAPALQSGAPLATAGLALLIVGFGFKVAAVPFHAWLPDTYEGATAPVASFLASASKKMGFAALFRVFFVAAVALRADWTPPFFVLAILTMTVGNAAALVQKSVKRLLAYSSIAHAGYILIPLGAATASAAANQVFLTGGLLHALAHAFMAGGAFVGLAAVLQWTGREDFEAFNGLSRRAPFTAFVMAVLLFSLAGVPPLLGFWSKAFLVLGSLQAGGLAVVLAVALILNSALSLFYYAKVVKHIYFLPPPEGSAPLRAPWGVSAALALCLFGVLLLGVYPTPAIELAAQASAALSPVP